MDGKAKDKLAAARAALPLAKDLQSVHANGSASLAELRDFLGGLKGKSPQEVIGIVSTSLLVQSLAIAFVATAGILLIFTVGPYLVYGPPQEKQAAKKIPPIAVPVEPAPPAPASAGATAESNVDVAAKAMGIDDAKAADPKANPLDSPDLDKLLEKTVD